MKEKYFPSGKRFLNFTKKAKVNFPTALSLRGEGSCPFLSPYQIFMNTSFEDGFGSCLIKRVPPSPVLYIFNSKDIPSPLLCLLFHIIPVFPLGDTNFNLQGHAGGPSSDLNLNYILVLATKGIQFPRKP